MISTKVPFRYSRELKLRSFRPKLGLRVKALKSQGFMIRKSLFFFLLIFAAISEGKPPQLTPRDVKVKIEEILKAHVCHKALTSELMERTLQNFLDELDPTKTYFLEGEIAIWVHPSEELLQGL